LKHGENNYGRPNENIKKNGERVLVHWTNRPIKDEQGNVVAILSVGLDFTQQIKMERALAESESKFRAIFDQASVGLALSSLKGTIMDMNDACCKMMGYTKKELIGKSTFDITYPEDRDSSKLRFENFEQDEFKTSRYEKRFVKRNGDVLWGLVGTTKIMDMGGKPPYLLSQIQDITELKMAEESLRESEENYRTIIEASPEPIIVYQGGKIAFDNAAAIKFFGGPIIDESLQHLVHPDDLEIVFKSAVQVLLSDSESLPSPKAIRSRVNDLISPENRDAILNNIKVDGEAIVGKSKYSTPIAIRTILKDKSIAWIEAIGGLIKWKGSSAVMMIWRDITEQKRAEKALQESEENYRTLFEASPEPMVVYQGGKIVFDNAAAIKFYGSSAFGESLTNFIYPDDMETILKIGAQFLLSDSESASSTQSVQDRINELISPKNREEMLKNFKVDGQASSGGSKFSTPREVRIILHDKSIAWVEVVGALIKWKGSSAILMIWRDITERKKMEDLLRKHSESLEELVQERTEQLRRSERMAIIGQTAAAVGHDLKGPLQTFVNAIYLTNRTLSSQRMAEADRAKIESYFAMMRSQIKYMNDLILDLQHMAKEIKPDQVEIKIKDIMDDIVSGIEIPPSIKLNLVVEGTAFIDLFLMKRAIINLATNAIQAMPDGGTLTIGSLSQEDATTIRVSDTGVGISEENMAKLFQPLFTTKSRGTGLGLIIVKRIVEAHGGKIEVKSILGEGTTFTIMLPTKAK
jgi:two-component system sporulation sensor kinase A